MPVPLCIQNCNKDKTSVHINSQFSIKWDTVFCAVETFWFDGAHSPFCMITASVLGFNEGGLKCCLGFGCL